MKKLLSYLYPLTQKRASDFSGPLEITLHNGKKMLDAKNANYSYGSLQRILHFGLKQVNLAAVHDVLLLGLGGGSMIRSLRDAFGYTGHITAVEIDKAIIDIAADEFGIVPGPGLTIIHDDAYHYVEHTTQQFDLVVIDLFIDDRVPPVFLSTLFLEKIGDLITPGGFVIFNAATHPLPASEIARMSESLTRRFRFKTFDRVDGSNTLLIGSKAQ